MTSSAHSHSPSTLNCEDCSIGDYTGCACEDHVIVFMCVAYRQEPNLDQKRNVPSILWCDIKHIQMKLPDICNKVQSKCVTLVMPINEDGTMNTHKNI